MADPAFMRIGLNIVGHQDMANSEPSPGLQPKDFTEQRNDALREGVKGLFLMNGGGTVAMLAFLQAIWKENPQLAKYVLVCIAFLTIGVFLAGLVQFFRYHTSFNFQDGRHVGPSRSIGFFTLLQHTDRLLRSWWVCRS